MRFIIYGAGGVGGVIGAQLHKAGTDIALIARGEHLGRLQTEGLRYQTPFVDECLQLPAFGHPEEIEPREDDVVIMTMKSQHTEAALDALRAVRGSNIPVVCCQNSVANERLALTRQGEVRYHLKTPYRDGTTHIVLEPLDFIARLAALDCRDAGGRATQEQLPRSRPRG